MSSGMPYIPHSPPIETCICSLTSAYLRVCPKLISLGIRRTACHTIEMHPKQTDTRTHGTKRHKKATLAVGPLKETVLWEKLLSFRQPRGRWQLWKDIATEREINFAVRELQAKLGWSWASWNPPRQDMVHRRSSMSTNPCSNVVLACTCMSIQIEHSLSY